MMNFSTDAHHDSPTSKENVPPSNKRDGSHVQRAKQRLVFGVLSENELRSRSLSQGSKLSKHSSASDSSQLAVLSCLSGSSFDQKDECDVVLAASGDEMMSDVEVLGDEAAAMEAARCLLELSSSSCHNASIQSRSDDSLLSEEVMCVSEYTEEIHQLMRETEVKFRPKPDNLEKHPEVTNSMRVVVVDWLVEVTQEFKMSSETLHLAVNYLDRFLSRTSDVKQCQMQLLGTTALMIAAKYEEVFPPDVDQFVYITDGTYNRKHLLKMEHVFLRVLGFRMTAPTIYQFVHQFLSIQAVCRKTENLTLFVADLSLLETDPFLQYNPSLLAAAAFCLANYTVNGSLWPDSLCAFTGYTTAEIAPCLTDLHKLYVGAEGLQQQAVRKKYSSLKYHRVSWIAPPTVLLLQ